ncbi:MAG: phosphoribosyl-AMP cyclohydrolase [Leptospirales bacterium]|nr:phosphoribosyl-AMP cyclohydrolase [Leptospirales bacterium]
MQKPDFGKQGGIVPAIAQDYENGEILMLAYMNEEAFKLTTQSGIVHYFSRSGNRIWKKGETSGNLQELKEMRLDCDSDTLLLKVKQIGAACHEGYRSCFFRILENGDFKIDKTRIMDPASLYGNKN